MKNKLLFSRSLALVSLIVLMMLPGRGWGQLFQQQFATVVTAFSGTNLVNATYINASPSNAQFTYIGSSGAGSVISISSNKLTLARTGNGWGFARGSSFTGPPTSLMVQFDYSTTGSTAAVTTALTFCVGGGTSAGSATTSITSSDTHSRLGFNCTATSGEFVVRDIGGSTNGATIFTGTQTILFVINNSGGSLTYRAPDGANETVANDVFDVWVGTSKQLDERAATTVAQTLSYFKCVSTGGNQTVNFSNMLMSTIPTTPTSSAATSITSAGFNANWGAVSSATGYRLDVATDAAFTALVSGYSNLDVGNVITYPVAGLSASTPYYYRVRSYNTYTVSTFTSGNSASQNPSTTSGSAPSLTISGTLSHGSSCPGVAATPIQYTITNNGPVQADGITVVSSGTNAADFVVSGLSSTSIAASGGQATYYVTFTPASLGSKSATITVASTTSGSNSPMSSLTGTGTTPVTPVVNATTGATLPTAQGATLNGNVTTLGVCPTLNEKGFVYSVTATNGNPLVGGTGVTKTAVGTSTIATGAYTLPLTGLPSSTGYTYKSYVYDGATYTYSTTAPTFSTTIALTISGTLNNGTVCPGVAASPQTYTITNNGAVSVDGIAVASSDAQFVVSAPSSTTITAGGTATYTVTFTPSSLGGKSATVTVSSTTSGIVSATSTPTGTGTTPVTPVVNATTGATSPTAQGATLNGNVTTLGVCPTLNEKGFVYSVTATNSNPLVGGTGVTKTAVGTSTIATGTYNLPLTGLPSSTGYTYKSYVYDGATYTYSATAPTFSTTIALTISGTTNNGPVCPGVAASPQTYTITNNGAVSVDGIAVASSDAQFVVSAPSSTTITAGGTATYTVTFTPSSSGGKSATVTISSTTSGIVSATSTPTGTGTTPVTAAVTSSAATPITGVAATLNGNVTTLGVCPATTEKGFVYSLTSTNSNPLVGGGGVTKTAVSGLTTGALTLPVSGLSNGTQYSFKAYVYDGANYTYSSPVLTFTTLTIPANDACSGALTISCGGTLTVDNTLASDDVLPAVSCGITGSNYKGVWFTVTPVASGSLTVTTCATTPSFDTYLRIYTGNCSSFATCVGSDDDGCGPSSGPSVMTFTASANTTYYILVTSYGASSSGPITISTTCPIDTPTATSATNISSAGFTANWIAAAGASSYKLDVLSSLFSINEDFNDGEFTSNPVWGGSTSSYSILTDNTLPSGTASTDGFFLGSNSSVGNSGLYIASSEVNEWNFSLGSPDFDPSSSNYIGVVLMSSATFSNVSTGSFNGYYLKIGVNSSPDPIELWKSSATTKTKIGSFPSSPDFTGTALTNGLNIRITRNGSGVFELFYSTGFLFTTPPTTSAGTLTDNTFSTSSYFGPYTFFGSLSATRRVYIDNIQLGSGTYISGYNDLTVNLTTQPVTLLSPNTNYYYRVRAVGGNSTSANSTVINVTTGKAIQSASTSNWNNAATWSPASIPTGIDDVTITASKPVNVDINPAVCANLTINAASSITIDAGKALTVNGTLTNSAGNTGLVIKSDASGTGSLITSNSVSATVERYILNDIKWHFLSSPVTAQNIWPNFAPTPNVSLNFEASGWKWDFYYWNPNCLTTAGNFPWVNLRLTGGAFNSQTIEGSGNAAGFGTHSLGDPAKFDIGRGYLAAYAPEYSGTAHDFTGSLNVGNQSTEIKNIVNPWQLVGNPYSSAIDWTATNGWDRTSLEPNTEGGYDYWIFVGASGNFGVFNSNGTEGSGTLGTTKDIAPMQAYFVQAASTGSLSITNPVANNVQVHSSQTWLKQAEATDNLVRIRLTTAANSYYDEMIISVNNAYENGGSSKFWSIYPEAPELYSIKAGKNYSIDRLQTAANNTTVNIGIKAGVSALYTITADLNSFTSGGDVRLEDLKTGTIQRLNDNPSYSFMAAPGENANRFVLHFGYAYAINENSNANTFSIYTSGNNISVVSNAGKVVNGDLFAYNLMGQQLMQQKLTVDKLTKISLNVPTGYYLVKVVTSDQAFSSKVFIHN